MAIRADDWVFLEFLTPSMLPFMYDLLRRHIMALMTTLYGVLAARFVFQPCSTKVRQLLGIQRFREYLILEGLMLILNKRSTFYIQDRLNSFLDRKNQYSMESAGEGK